jgi:hypothetical protein
MDEVLKALDEKEKQAEAATTPSPNSPAHTPSFNGRDFGDHIDPNRVDLEDVKTPINEEKTLVFEEKGFSAYRESYDWGETKPASPPPLPTQPPRLVSIYFFFVSLLFAPSPTPRCPPLFFFFRIMLNQVCFSLSLVLSDTLPVVRRLKVLVLQSTK